MPKYLYGGVGVLIPLIIFLGITNGIAYEINVSPWIVGGVILLGFFGLLGLMETNLFDGYS